MDEIDVCNIYEQVKIILDKFLKDDSTNHVVYCDKNPITEFIDAFEQHGYFTNKELFSANDRDYDYTFYFKNGERKISYCVSSFYNKTKLTKLW